MNNDVLKEINQFGEIYKKFVQNLKEQSKIADQHTQAQHEEYAKVIRDFNRQFQENSNDVLKTLGTLIREDKQKNYQIAIEEANKRNQDDNTGASNLIKEEKSEQPTEFVENIE